MTLARTHAGLVFTCDHCGRTVTIDDPRPFEPLHQDGWVSAIDPRTGLSRHLCAECNRGGFSALDDAMPAAPPELFKGMFWALIITIVAVAVAIATLQVIHGD